MIRFIKKIIAGQKKLNISILAVLSLLASFELITVILYSSSNSIEDIGSSYMLKISTGLIIIIAFVLTLFVNNYIINNKNEEFSLVLLCGKTLKQIVCYILIQFGVLFTCSYVIGTVLGIGWLILFESYFNVNITLDYQNIVFIYLALYFTKILYVVMIDLGKFIRIKLNIAGYMNHVPEKTTNFNAFKVISSGMNIDEDSKRKGRIPVSKILSSMVGIFFIVVGFTPLLTSDNNSNISVYFNFSLIGELYIINTTIPLLFDIFHNKVLLKAKNWIISLSNFIDLSNAMVAVINISSIIVPMIIMLLYIQPMDSYVQSAMMMSFFALMASMFLCFIIRFMIYLPNRSNTIATLKAIGYSYKDIIKIHYQEMLLFICLIVLFPILMYGMVLYKSYTFSLISFDTFITMIVIYVVLYMILSFYMIYSYRNLVKEVYNDVKYLNHSE